MQIDVQQSCQREVVEGGLLCASEVLQEPRRLVHASLSLLKYNALPVVSKLSILSKALHWYMLTASRLEFFSNSR